MSEIEVLSPGLLTTIQDLGRPGYEDIGISPSGAADPVSLRLGNRLVENSEGEAALELTLFGPTLRFQDDALIALAGGDFGAELDGQKLKSHKSYVVRAGQTLKTSAATNGCRSYLCVRGGIDIPLLFGSKATHVQSGMGGLAGRGLKAGDRVPIVTGLVESQEPGREVRAEFIESLASGDFLRVTDSIHTSLFSETIISDFYSQKFMVSDYSNRLGLRLEGQPLTPVPEILTTGVSLGSIQVSSNGQPTLLFVESQLTGGYPQIACVIGADGFKIGQLKPRSRIRFERVSIEEAVEAYRALELALTSEDIFF